MSIFLKTITIINCYYSLYWMKYPDKQNDIPAKGLSHHETFEKCSILFKAKEGDNFNHRNTLSILRIKI